MVPPFPPTNSRAPSPVRNRRGDHPGADVARRCRRTSDPSPARRGTRTWWTLRTSTRSLSAGRWRTSAAFKSERSVREEAEAADPPRGGLRPGTGRRSPRGFQKREALLFILLIFFFFSFVHLFIHLLYFILYCYFVYLFISLLYLFSHLFIYLSIYSSILFIYYFYIFSNCRLDARFSRTSRPGAIDCQC